MMSQCRNRRESGFALILALLSLLLLTTMGLALSTNTSIELQISTNHRWSEAARYNAEAGLEYGRSLLVTVADWSTILPPPRLEASYPDWSPTAWVGGTKTSTTGMANLTNATRNFENWQCDAFGYGMGYGVVFDDGGAEGPLEYKSTVAGVTLNGAFTLWVRRPVMWNGGNGTGAALQDYPTDEVLMLVSEGVAPFRGANNASAMAASSRAVYTVEALLTRQGAPVLDQSACNTRQGQAGSSASGTNSAGCISLTAGRQITEALAGVSNVGTGELK